jgi:Xaa-Pro dipeptidase
MFQDFYDAHVKTMQGRWEAAMRGEDCAAVLVHAGTPLVSYLDDYVYAFRPNPLFLSWLPLTHHPDSALLIRHGEKPLLWFYQPEDYWHLPPADPEPWWAQYFEVRVVSDPDTWRHELPPARNALAVLGDAPWLGDLVATDRFNPPGLVTRLHLDRTRKTDYEVACMRQANHIAARAHEAARQAFLDGKCEFDIHLEYLAVCQQNDAELPYNSIVALNDHGSVLHYQRRERVPPLVHRSFLIDAGSTVNAYAADITRTYSAASDEFAGLITAMDRMQQELCGEVTEGVDFRRLHLSAHHRIAAILETAGIINMSPEDAVTSGLSSVFYPHGLGHFIGLQTHDVAGLIDNNGEAIPRPAGHPYLRLTRKLEAGNAVTIEPGLYFTDPLLNQWKSGNNADAINWKAVERLKSFGGIRIEDNVVVREGGCDNLTRPAFAGL